MADGDLYLTDSTSIYRLPAAYILDGNRSSNWQRLGVRRNLQDGFEIRLAGGWVTVGQDPISRVPVEANVHTDRASGSNQPGQLIGNLKHIYLGSSEPQPHQEDNTAPTAITVDIRDTRYVSLYDEHGRQTRPPALGTTCESPPI